MSWPRRAAAAVTALAALAACSLVAAPALADLRAGPCALPRTAAHHSEGLNTWNGSYPRPDGRLDAVLVYLSFPGTDPATSPRQLSGDYFPATSRFYDTASYGRTRLVPHVRPDWVRMPKPAAAYAIQRDWNGGQRSAYLRDALAAADPGTDFARYDLVYFVADPDAPGVNSDATKVVNLGEPLHADGRALRRIVTVFEQHPPDHNVLAHETGHVFDLPDLYRRPADGKGDWDTHVGDWDLMGSQFALSPDFLGWHKWKLGWLRDTQVSCLRGTGTTRLSLAPLSAPAAPPGVRGAPRLAVVRTGQYTALAMEIRTAAGNDRTTCTEGLLLYEVHTDTASAEGPVKVLDAHPGSGACEGTSVLPALADAPVGVGETFSVPGRTLQVAVEGTGPDGEWTVRVTRTP
ncbi:M6 family metalloprotease domain-containing protein [Streptomyces sp. NPDC049954]|uniref:M6 family metalloprotease domain-containing protein n=1 Tax=Streptomyces sp. NPDC049954 TaxID=3155779 RepID=UPI0034193D89